MYILRPTTMKCKNGVLPRITTVWKSWLSDCHHRWTNVQLHCRYFRFCKHRPVFLVDTLDINMLYHCCRLARAQTRTQTSLNSETTLIWRYNYVSVVATIASVVTESAVNMMAIKIGTAAISEGPVMDATHLAPPMAWRYQLRPKYVKKVSILGKRDHGRFEANEILQERAIVITTREGAPPSKSMYVTKPENHKGYQLGPGTAHRKPAYT